MMPCTTLRVRPAPAPGTGNVWGIAKGAAGRPVRGVRVVIAGKTDITGDDGKYEIMDIPAGSYIIRYYYAGEEYTKTVEIIAGETVRKDLPIFVPH